MQVCKYANMHICNYANIQICRHANMQICTFANMPTCKYANHANMQTWREAFFLGGKWCETLSSSSPFSKINASSRSRATSRNLDIIVKSYPNEALSILGDMIFDMDSTWCEALTSRGQVSKISWPSRKYGKHTFSPSLRTENCIEMKDYRYQLE